MEGSAHLLVAGVPSGGFGRVQAPDHGLVLLGSRIPASTLASLGFLSTVAFATVWLGATSPINLSQASILPDPLAGGGGEVVGSESGFFIILHYALQLANGVSGEE